MSEINFKQIILNKWNLIVNNLNYIETKAETYINMTTYLY